MPFAFIANVQANVSALRAVLESIDEQERVDRVVCAGDIVGLGPNPNEVIALLRERKVETIRGNYDDAVVFDRLSSGVDFPDAESEDFDRQALVWTREALDAVSLEFLRTLPRDIRLIQTGGAVEVERKESDHRVREYREGFFTRTLLGGALGSAIRGPKLPSKSLAVYHGSPRALNELVREESAASILTTIAGEAGADVVVSAHAGTTFDRSVDRARFIGPGSVAGPHAAPGIAQYALVDLGKAVTVSFEQVEYDPSEHLRAMRLSGLPESRVSPLRFRPRH